MFFNTHCVQKNDIASLKVSTNRQWRGGESTPTCVRMAERSKALRSGRSLPWRRGFESHFWQLCFGAAAEDFGFVYFGKKRGWGKTASHSTASGGGKGEVLISSSRCALTGGGGRVQSCVRRGAAEHEEWNPCFTERVIKNCYRLPREVMSAPNLSGT